MGQQKNNSGLSEYDGPVVVIVGSTGSGKTMAAINLAERIKIEFGREAEIISADSRAIYKGMDIGTAKPNRAERARVKHHGLDLVEPGERFTVYEFKNYTEKKIKEIRSRGNIPVIVGGTGLYVDAVIYDYKFSTDEQKSCSDRTEVCSGYGVFGIKWRPEELRARLKERLNKLFIQEELFIETRGLVEKYGWGSQAMKSNIYQFVWRYLEGEIDFNEMMSLSFYDDWHLAKRQETWFKRNKEIRWERNEVIVEKILEYLRAFN